MIWYRMLLQGYFLMVHEIFFGAKDLGLSRGDKQRDEEEYTFEMMVARLSLTPRNHSIHSGIFAILVNMLR